MVFKLCMNEVVTFKETMYFIFTINVKGTVQIRHLDNENITYFVGFTSAFINSLLKYYKTEKDQALLSAINNLK